MAESLETRQLLSSLSTHPSASVTGTDTAGDVWTLTLFGPGTLNVVDQQGMAFPATNESDKNDPNVIPGGKAEINTITVSGTVTSESRLVGKVTYVPPTSNGRVFFQQLNINNTGAYGQLDPALVHPRASIPQNGIAAVDMPKFWLGNTTPYPNTTTSPTTPKPAFPSQIHANFFVAGGINAPEGIQTLRFGGVDTTVTPGGAPLNATHQSNEFIINLGPPITIGTSIIVDKVITDAAPGPIQQSVTFLVDGRLNLFQANEIDATPAATTTVPTQFESTPPVSANPGGTYVVSQAGGGTSFGQIGTIRIVGKATNFTAFAIPTDIFSPPVDSSFDPRIRNFFIGGATNNVILVAPGGSRNVFFGGGMNNTKIGTQFIQNLWANSGASNSNVTVSRTIGNMIIGGDVVNTTIQSGYSQTLASDANVPTSSTTPATGAVNTPATGVFNGFPLPTIVNRVQNNITAIFQPIAHGGGAIHGQIGGNVNNSIISVSVDPNPSGLPIPPALNQFELTTGKTFPFGSPDNIVLPRGVIDVKVKGQVDNRGLLMPPQAGQTNPFGGTGPFVSSNQAFFAKTVILKTGAVIHVPEAPSPPTVFHNGQRTLRGLFKIDNSVQFPHRPAAAQKTAKA